MIPTLSAQVSWIKSLIFGIADASVVFWWLQYSEEPSICHTDFGSQNIRLLNGRLMEGLKSMNFESAREFSFHT